MRTLTLRTRVSTDGTIDLHLPCDLPPGDTEVLVVVQPVNAAGRTAAGASSLSTSLEASQPLRISLAEAGVMARRILLEAEQARLRFAEEEAQKGIHWERLP